MQAIILFLLLTKIDTHMYTIEIYGFNIRRRNIKCQNIFIINFIPLCLRRQFDIEFSFGVKRGEHIVSQLFGGINSNNFKRSFLLRHTEHTPAARSVGKCRNCLFDFS